MSPSVTAGSIQKTCPYCEKFGLPIMPLRYAVARADMGDAPELAAPFGAGVKDIRLPAKQAHYTLRLLRAGYLYVYDARYGKRGWSAYQVDEGGYLYPFDPNVEPPASGFAKEHFSCSRKGNDPYIARCFTVNDAATATQVWLGFSDVLWTPAVLDKHASAAYRNAHMRCIDVAQVRAGSDQPHAAKLAGLSVRVAEYATTPTMLYAQTQPYVKKYLPTPLTDPRQLLGDSDEATFAWKLCSTLVTGLLPSAVDAPLQTNGRYPSAPWAFSHTPLFADAELAPKMEQWAAEAAKPYHPAMVAVDDPAGVALELNGLIQQLTAEFTEEPQRKWKHETALAIQMLKRSVENGGVKGQIAENRKSAEASEGVLLNYGGASAPGVWQGLRDAESGILSARQQAAVENSAWAKYAKELGLAGNDDALAAETTAKLDTALNPYMPTWRAYKAAHVTPVVDSYLAWVKAGSFTHYFTHNYDANDMPSGHAFTEVLGTVFDGLGGVMKVVDYLTVEVKKDPAPLEALVARGVALNQDKLVSAWTQGAVASADHQVGLATVLGVAAAVYGPWEALMTDDKAASYKGIAKYVYRISQAVLKALTHEPLEAAMHAAYGLRWYGALGAVAKLENPNLTLVVLQEEKTPQQAAKALNRALGKVLGRGGFETAVGHEVGGKAKAMRAVALVDEGKLVQLRRGPNGKVAGAELRNAVRVGSIDDAIEETAALTRTGPAAGGAIGFILTAVTCSLAIKDWGVGGVGVKQELDLTGQAASLSGSSFDAAGSVKGFFEARRAAAGFVEYGSRAVDSAEWLSGAGRILGGAGGIIAGVVGIWDGIDEYQEGHTAIGAATVVGGGIGVLAGILMFTPLAGVAVLVGLAAAVLMLVIAYFTPNAVQDWINRSKLGVQSLTGAYKGLIPQQMALKALGG